MKVFLTGACVLFLCFANNIKILNANVLDNIGACSGVVIGNASVDFSLGNMRSFEDGIKLSLTAYLSEVFSKQYSQENIIIADKILSSNTDKIINLANTQTFDETTYEEVINCYRMLGVLIIKNTEIIKNNSKKIDKFVVQKSKLLKRMLSAG